MDLLILIAALIIAWLVFTWLIQVIKVSLNTAVIIAVFVLILQLVFGIGPVEVWQQLVELSQSLGKLLGN